MSIDYFVKHNNCSKSIRGTTATAELTVNLDINLSTVLFKMVRKGTPETKLKGCRIALNSLKEAVEILLALGPEEARITNRSSWFVIKT